MNNLVLFLDFLPAALALEALENRNELRGPGVEGQDSVDVGHLTPGHEPVKYPLYLVGEIVSIVAVVGQEVHVSVASPSDGVNSDLDDLSSDFDALCCRQEVKEAFLLGQFRQRSFQVADFCGLSRLRHLDPHVCLYETRSCPFSYFSGTLKKEQI